MWVWRFLHFTKKIEKELNVSFTEKIDDFDSLFWIFEYKSCKMVVSYDVFHGISIYPKNAKMATEEDNLKIYDLKEALERASI